MTTTKDTSWTTLRRQTAEDTWAFGVNGGPTTKFRGSPLTLQRTRVGTNNPKWKQQVEDHQNATTNMAATYDSHERRGARASLSFNYLYDGVHRTPRTASVRGDMYFGAFAAPIGGSWTADAEKIARARYYAQIRNTQRRFMGQVFAGELKETLRMIRNPAEGLRRQIGNVADKILGLAQQRKISARRLRDLKKATRQRGKKLYEYNRDLRRFVNDVGGTWLENAFGLQPLLADCEDARDALNSLMKHDQTVKVQAGGHAAYLHNNTVFQSGPDVVGAPIFGLNTLVDKETYIVRYRGAVDAQAETAYGRVAERFGFSFADFVPSAWELLPWSFLLDYFANIGDCLEAAFTNTAGVTWTNTTYIHQRTIARYWSLDVKRTKDSYGSDNIFYIEPGDPAYWIWKRRFVNRQAGIGAPAPFGMFRFKFPAFDSQAGKWLNMSALLSQMIAVHPQDVIRRGYRR